MPNLPSAFTPPKWLGGGHVQTVLPVFLRRRIRLRFAPEPLELEDGDFLDLAWARVDSPAVAIITHGLEGDAQAGYVRGLARALNGAGWSALAWAFRGCGPELNRLARFYHSGETGDLSAVVRHAAQSYRRVAVIGFSLGGNVTLKYLGEAAPHPAVCAGVAVSAPVDLAASARELDERRHNRLYLRIFLRSLIRKIELKARRFPEALEVAGIRSIRTFREFDDRYTAPLHGFQDAAEYWARSSSRQFLPAIGIPTLLLNARNDPMLGPECFPFAEAEASAHLHFEAPASGGHVGFIDFRRGLQPWWERRVLEFLREHAPVL